jgi:thymidylate kinase
MSRTVVISLEGNIGAGKSTLLTRLQQAAEIYSHRSIEFVQEPVSRWSGLLGKPTLEPMNTQSATSSDNLLSCFYADPQKYAFPFQIMAYATQIDELNHAIRKKPAIVLTERSLESNREIFTKMFYDDGKIDPVHYQIYCENANTCRRLCNHPTSTDAVIYLRTQPEVCIQRIQERGREGEEQITLDYLKTCDNYHESWLGDLPADQCFVLDANENISFYQLCEILDFMDKVATRIRGERQTDVARAYANDTEVRRADIYGW